MKLKTTLKQQVDSWAKLGHPAPLERFLIRNGYPAKAKPWVRKMEAKQCYSNASEIVIELGDARYVEGYAWRKGLIPIHHAWVEIDGEAMDPTMERPEECQYLGWSCDRGFLVAQLLKNGVYGLFDLGVGINLALLFEIDPGLKEIVHAISNSAALPNGLRLHHGNVHRPV